MLGTCCLQWSSVVDDAVVEEEACQLLFAVWSSCMCMTLYAKSKMVSYKQHTVWLIDWSGSCAVWLYSVDEMKLLLADDDKLQEMLASRVDQVNDVQQKVVLFLEKFASTFSLLDISFSGNHYQTSCCTSTYHILTLLFSTHLLLLCHTL